MDWHRGHRRSLVDQGFADLAEPIMLCDIVALIPETRTLSAHCEAFLAHFKSDVGAATAAVHAPPRPRRGK